MKEDIRTKRTKLKIKEAFSQNGVDSYLDVLDSSLTSSGKELTIHIKNNFNNIL